MMIIDKILDSPLDEKQPIRSFLKKSVTILIKSGIAFNKDQCFLKASALTFYSLLSIVPVLAVAFGIAKGFGFDKHLEAEVLHKLQDQPEIAEKVINFTYSMLEHAKGGLIAGVGILILFWSVIKLLSNIENSLNDIWKVQKARSFSRKLNDYLAIIIFCPIFFVISSSISIFVVTKIVHVSRETSFFDSITTLLDFCFHFFPMVLSWFLFTLIYIIMPNTRVSWRNAFIAGVLAGTTYQLIQWTYINFQVGLANYGAIYGSFAALPLFLVWLNLSWLIVLAGAEIAYHLGDNEKKGAKTQWKREKAVVVIYDERVLEEVKRCIEKYN